ncbi:MAG: hypothetical protein PHQ98_02310, partial [Candidatus ainarchaeum sp.]|nr:hypothetical protein [Candidatus ainarchaeum sp.]
SSSQECQKTIDFCKIYPTSPFCTGNYQSELSNCVGNVCTYDVNIYEKPQVNVLIPDNNFLVIILSVLTIMSIIIIKSKKD